MNLKTRLISAALASLLALAIGVCASWPIYQSTWLILVAAVAWFVGTGVAALAAVRRGGVLVTVAALAIAFVVTVVPVAVPQSFDRMPSGLWQGFTDGLAATALGWKQLLTLTLPVGEYQTMLVPAYLVFLLTAFVATTLTARAGRFAPLAAFPLLFPVAFGTVFGSSELSAPVRLGPFTLTAPREIALWGGAIALGALWIWWTAGAERRAALRRGRLAGESPLAGGRAARGGIAAATVLVGVVAGALVAPTLSVAAREVPRDNIAPEVVVRDRPSPLATYRSWKTDDALDIALFTVETRGGTPHRLRLAVLDSYDGVDFHVSQNEAGSFTRFPTGGAVPDPAEVSISIDEGYADIWAPTAELASAPSFGGPRASELADAFYVNRGTGAAIAVPGGASTGDLREGDEYRATMSAAPDVELTGEPDADSLIDLDAMPELAHWVEVQNQSANPEGLLENIQRLRNRGYLSHSISDSEGSQLWLERLSQQYGTRFEPSAGGHSIARIEQVFAQLNTQERLAGENASPDMLVAGIGDDEQFATAAALIAQSMGFEARVVVGVRLGDDEAGVPGVPACDEVCTGENVAAWVEVRTASGDWAPIDTTPQLEMRPTTLEEGQQLPEFPTTPEELDADEVDPPIGVGERSNQESTNDPTPEPSWIWPVLRAVALGLGALLLLALLFLFIPVAKRVRTAARRGQRDPELAALGAWHEMTDRAVDAGVRIPRDASRSEVAALLGTAPAQWAAQQVDRAVFAPDGVTADDAQWLWSAVEADRAERESQLGFWRRMGAAYSLRSYGVRRDGRTINQQASTVDASEPENKE